MAGQQQQQCQVTYASPHKSAAGIRQMSKSGWEVVTTSQYERHRGCLMAWWPIKPQPQVMVTFRRG